jgi:hypothetical protein
MVECVSFIVVVVRSLVVISPDVQNCSQEHMLSFEENDLPHVQKSEIS